MIDEPAAKATLDVNPETVCQIIGLAKEFHAKEEVVIPEDAPLSPSEDWARQVLADHADDPTYQELKGMIRDLEFDQQDNLVALMWVGRGDFSVSEWQSALDAAGARRSSHTADYLIASPLVASYLEEGLNQLGYSCEE